uniref:Odorant receptor n=1 Tax=Mayetiola destructor TaxID=39758 RepID=A0A1D8GZG1_MAYDE|nr:odorant receptor 115 [Mayetiola destructor]
MEFTKSPFKIWSVVKEMRKIYNNWDALTPAKQIYYIYELGRFSGIAAGFRSMHDCRIVLSSFMLAIILLMYYILAFYTIYIRTIDGRFAEGLQCLSISGIYSYGLVGYIVIVFTKKRFRIPGLCKFSHLNVYNDDHASTKYNQLCKQNIKRSVKRIKLIMLLTLVSIIVGAANPTYMFFKTGKFYSLTGVLIPGIDEGSPNETYFNAIYLIGSSMYAGVSLLYVQICSGILCDTIVLTSDIIVLEMEELSEHLERNDLKSIEVRLRAKRIILQILKSDEYVADISDIYYWYFFTSPYLLTYAIALAMYSQYLMDFPCGYGLAGMSYIQLFVLCIIGQTTVDSREKIRIGLGNFKWYLIRDMEVRRDIGFILQQVQNGSLITMGPFNVLNYEFAGILTQRIHSFMMLLINFGK